MTEFAFDESWLGLLWLVPLVLAAGVYGLWRRRQALARFADPALWPQVSPPTGWGRPVLRLVLVGLCLLALVAAIINPRWGEREQEVTRRNLDILVLLDVSRSMLARDIAPNRLERAKLALRDDLLPALGGDRIGLITFAGVPSLKCPLTNDYGFFRLALDDVSVTSAPRGGTLIGDAIRKAAECFPPQLDTNRLILLITDGEDHESFPVEAASAVWQDHRIPIVAIALGDEQEGARIPIETEQGERYLEYQGRVVWTRANFDDLRRIAAVSELNAFVPVGTLNFDLGEIYRRVIVPRVQAQDALKRQTVPLPSRYHPFALAALVLLLVESLLGPGPWRAAVTATVPRRRGVAA